MKTSRLISLGCVIFSLIIFVFCIIDLCMPWFLGAKIDTDIIKNIDTNVITENYTKFDYSEYEDGRILFIKYYEYSDDNFVEIHVKIYPDNIYSEEAEISLNFDKYDGNYYNWVSVRKNNVDILIYEKTTESRSDKIQEAFTSFLQDLNVIG